MPTNTPPTATIGQLFPAKGVIDARKCRLQFHFNPHLRGYEPAEYRVPPDELAQYPAIIDHLPVVADPTGTVLPGHIFLCTQISVDEPGPVYQPIPLEEEQ